MKLKLYNENGAHQNGRVTFVAGGTITRGTPVKFASGKVVAAAAAADLAIGIALNDATADDYVAVAVLGNYVGTVLLKAGGVIAQGAQVTSLGTATTANTDMIIGVALNAATAAGDLIEIAHQVAQVK